MVSGNSPDSNGQPSDPADGAGETVDLAQQQRQDAGDEDQQTGLGHLDLMKLDTIDIPDQTQFKIGEVAKLLDLEPYVLRYWEKEFELLSPAKTDSGQRTYHRDDIELAATIRHLLYTEMFKIDGARRQLELASDGEPSYLTTTLNDEGAPDTSQEANQLREEKSALADELEQARAEIQKLRDQRRDLRTRIEDLREQLDRQGEGGEAEQEVEKWRQRAAEYQQKIEQLESELSGARETIETMREEATHDDGLDADAVETQRELLADMKREVSALSQLAAG
jgi:DNA-binding transcriptional MerR regulator